MHTRYDLIADEEDILSSRDSDYGPTGNDVTRLLSDLIRRSLSLSLI